MSPVRNAARPSAAHLAQEAKPASQQHSLINERRQTATLVAREVHRRQEPCAPCAAVARCVPAAAGPLRGRCVAAAPVAAQNAHSPS